MTSRIDKITQTIENAFEDSWQDGYHTGIDEAWDEAKNKGYDEGWDDCNAHVLKEIELDKDGRCARDDAGERICSYATHKAGYDEGFDTAMTNFEADNRVLDLTDAAFGDGYNQGIRHALRELRDKINVDPSGFFGTPENAEDLIRWTEGYKENGFATAQFTINWVFECINKVKRDHAVVKGDE